MPEIVANNPRLPLGIITKSASAPRTDPLVLQKNRWQLLYSAKKILKNERICDCQTRKSYACASITKKGHKIPEVSVYRNSEKGTGFYKGLVSCGSVWVCPVCGNRISEKRRAEVCTAINTQYHNGGMCLLLTYTFPHTRDQLLKKNLDSFLKGVREMTSGRWYQTMKKSLGIVGAIKSLEVTWGNNGWHPHAHILLYVDRISKAEIFFWEHVFRAQWEKIVKKNNLGKINEHGVKLIRTTSSEYITKHSEDQSQWGGDRELVRGTTKGSKGLNVWQILERCAETKEGKFYETLFCEFHAAFKGRRQLVWSRGLKKYFKIKELTDEQILSMTPEKAEYIGTIPNDVWQKIEMLRWQSDFLFIACKYGFQEAISEFYAYFREKNIMILRE
jgi:hypothetical protein